VGFFFLVKRAELENNTVISLESLGHIKGLHWLSGSTSGIYLVATKSPASTFWLVYLHSNEPLVVSFRCLIFTDPKQRWLTREDSSEVKLGVSETDERAQWNVKWNTDQSCFLWNTNGSEEMYLDGYTTVGRVGFVVAPKNNPKLYTGAYWGIVLR
jgi:hypothetical protein